ncbi:MAG: metal ABC transporter permease [Peptostreptococcaceae bacterium]|nr:metal ABC transporter permease [Peptostreptococcaceae bacterium]
MDDVIRNIFMDRVVVSAFFASILCGIVGTVIVEKNIVMMSGGIAHMVFGGVGLGFLMGFEPVWGALAFAVAGALIMAAIKQRDSRHIDGLVGVLWALGMALGSIFIYLKPGESPNIDVYLFGDIEAVRLFDLYPMAILTSIVAVLALAYMNHLKAYLFDETFAEVSSGRKSIFDYFVYIIVGVSVVVILRLVGIILAIALLTIPPMIAGRFTNRIESTMALSSVLGFIFTLAGIGLAYKYSLPSGATIILVSSAAFAATLPMGR